MKRFRLITAAALLIGAAVCAYAQAQEPPQKDQPQVFYGRGRGGVPFAWNDMNGDGICDLTGQPVGQRPIGFGRGQGRWAAVGPPTGQRPVGFRGGRGGIRGRRWR